MQKRSYLRQRRSPRQSKLRKNLLSFLTATLVLLAIAGFRLTPAIKKSMEYQGRMVSLEVLTDETMAVLNEMDLSYGDIVQMSKDDEGKISSIEMDGGKINRIKTTLEKKVLEAFREKGTVEYRIPLGTLLGIDYLSGRGPGIPMKLIPMGYLQGKVESEFESAGINQTSHRLILNLTMKATTIVPFRRSDITVSTNFVLAETVIVGQVPDYYTNIGRDGSDALSGLGDYSLDQNDFADLSEKELLRP